LSIGTPFVFGVFKFFRLNNIMIGMWASNLVILWLQIMLRSVSIERQLEWLCKCQFSN